MKKRMIIMIIALIIIFGGIFGWDAIRSHMIKEYIANYEPPPVTISATKVQSTTWKDFIPAAGTIYSYNSVDITPQQSGQIDKIYFKSGDIVKAGQPLIGQNTELDVQTLKSDKAKLALAKITYERYLTLSKRSFVSQSELDQSLAQYEEAQANVKYTEEVIREKTIRAPFTGKIGIREVNLGQYVTPSDKLTSLQSLNPLRVIFSVPEQYLPDIKPGLAVNLTVQSHPKQVFKGVVSAIDSKINEDTRNFDIEARIPNDDLQLYPGMFANVDVVLPQEKNVLTIPVTAISFNLYGNIVYVLSPESQAKTTTNKKSDDTKKKTSTKTDKDSKDKTQSDQQVYVAKTTYVTVAEQRDNTAVITKGLKAGELIVTSGQLKLRNGARVVINNSIDPSKTPDVINPEE